jgi:hypothetical protein
VYWPCRPSAANVWEMLFRLTGSIKAKSLSGRERVGHQEIWHLVRGKKNRKNFNEKEWRNP